MHAGKKIKIIRAIKNLSQTQLAEKIGRTRALISHIEQTGKINHYTLKEILKIFKMSESDFDKFEPKETMKQYSEDLVSELENVKKELEAVKRERDLLQEHNDLYRRLLKTLDPKAAEKKK